MSGEPFELVRARRDAAWTRVRGNLAVLRGSVAERPITARVKDEAKSRALGVLGEAKAVALGNIPVIAGTAALLAGWFFRRPLMRLIKNRFAATSDNDAAQADEDVT
ncbi:MAG: hypothetical protein WCL10_17660 [Novosphingobium sp.]|jgi:hypothetical protein|uniref:hypothetical protein n=1 Tax=Novosphingobium sp. TaxID=1874826 RepID=UPI003015915B